MKTYVAEIAGQPIVAFRAKNLVNALSLAHDPAGCVCFALIGADHVHKDGRPLWDGKSDIGVRQATSEESRRHWIATFDARRDGDKIDKHLVVWLVPVVTCASTVRRCQLLPRNSRLHPAAPGSRHPYKGPRRLFRWSRTRLWTR